MFSLYYCVTLFLFNKLKWNFLFVLIGLISWMLFVLISLSCLIKYYIFFLQELCKFDLVLLEWWWRSLPNRLDLTSE